MNNLWDDYLKFHRAALASKDVDPVYPVYKALLDRLGLSPRSGAAFWLTVCHVTWYDMGSAIRAWSLLREGVPIEKLPRLPCATERRGNRDDRQLLANLNSWKRLGPQLTSHELPNNPALAWHAVLRRIQVVHGNGRWAAYKMAEILQKVNEWPLAPQDMGHQNSSGPRHGLSLLIKGLPEGNTVEDIRRMDMVSREFVEGIRARGIPAPIEEVETTLCDFHSLVKGRYYVGNDIDQMQEQLRRGEEAVSRETGRPSEMEVFDAAWPARSDALPHEYLGELNGWTGVDKARQKAYRDTGEVLVR